MAFWVKIFENISQIKVKSITDQLFKYGTIVLFFLVVAAIFKVDQWLLILIAVLVCLFYFIGVVAYIYFSYKNPEYLRSEDYQLKNKGLDLIGDKNNVKNPHITTIPSLTSPYGPEKGGREIEIK